MNTKVLGLCFSLLFSASVVSASPIKIGYITDLSGKGAFVGVPSQFGAELAVKDLERQGISVEIAWADTKTDPKVGISEAQRMIQLLQVDGFCSDLTPVSTAISPVLRAAKKVLFYQSPSETITRENPFAFRNFLDYDRGCEAAAQHFKTQGLTRIANLKMNAEFGELCVKGVQRVFSDAPIHTYDSGEDFHSIMARWKQDGIQAIIQTGYEVDTLNRFRAGAQIHFEPEVGTPIPMLTRLVRETLGKAIERTVFFGYPGVSMEFLDRVKEVDPKHDLTNIDSAAIAYFNVRELARAINACGNSDLECQLQHIEKRGSDPILGFKGWLDRKANYPIGLYREIAGTLAPVSEEQRSK